MKSSRALVLSMLGTFVILLTLSGMAYAAELKGTVGSLNALNTGYAITRWPPSGGEYMVGEYATMRACTTKTVASHVVFRWQLPDGSSFDTDMKPLNYLGDTWDGDPIYEASDTQQLTQFGDYGVQALFIDASGKLQGPNPYPIVKIKAISAHAIAEVPFGTIATILSMLGGIGVFAIVKRKRAIPKIP